MQKAIAQAYSDPCRPPRKLLKNERRPTAEPPTSMTEADAISASQLWTIGYLARIASIFLNAVSAAVFGSTPLRMMSASAEPQICCALHSAHPGLNTGEFGTVSLSRPSVPYALTCGSPCVQKGSFLATDGIVGSQRPRPSFKKPFETSGLIRYVMNSLATSMLLAPLGMKAPPIPNSAVIGVPSFLFGKPIVVTSARSALSLIATSVEIVPSRSITNSFEWNALLSSASFQLNPPD